MWLLTVHNWCASNKRQRGRSAERRTQPEPLDMMENAMNLEDITLKHSELRTDGSADQGGTLLRLRPNMVGSTIARIADFTGSQLFKGSPMPWHAAASSSQQQCMLQAFSMPPGGSATHSSHECAAHSRRYSATSYDPSNNEMLPEVFGIQELTSLNNRN